MICIEAPTLISNTVLPKIEGVASGLQYLHAIDIVSADIVAVSLPHSYILTFLKFLKFQSKILVGDNDTSLISDFTITANKSLAWKVRWLPPEFIYNDCAALYDPSVDIWMFGLFVQVSRHFRLFEYQYLLTEMKRNLGSPY